MRVLTPAQQEALAYVGQRSSGGQLDPHVPLTINFHPDVLAAGPLGARSSGKRSLGRAWVDEPVYRSQFVTDTSNGGLTAVPGGERWRWESRMFGGAYDDVDPAERPVYGALNLFGYPYGGAVRFGSAHLVLAPDLLGWTTFCYPDSTLEPQAVGTAERAALVALASRGVPDRLDDYVEAQVHGAVRLSDAVELVLDPAFHGTAVAESVEILQARGLSVRWHAGFVLTVEEMRAVEESGVGKPSALGAYRGPEVVALGRALAQDGLLTPAILGLSREDPTVDPQLLKRLWHCLARFGYAGRETASGEFVRRSAAFEVTKSPLDGPRR